MNKAVLVFVPRRKLLTPSRVERLSDVFMEIGKLSVAGFVVGYFLPDSGVSAFQFMLGLLAACFSFSVSVLFSQERRGNGN